MKKIAVLSAGMVLSLFAVSGAGAASFADNMDRCLSKNANTKDAAMVMLKCTADGGKLSACKVVSDSAPGKGFDKAALCVAEFLPMGSKTGDVTVPMRFPGS